MDRITRYSHLMSESKIPRVPKRQEDGIYRQSYLLEKDKIYFIKCSA